MHTYIALHYINTHLHTCIPTPGKLHRAPSKNSFNHTKPMILRVCLEPHGHLNDLWRFNLLMAGLYRCVYKMYVLYQNLFIVSNKCLHMYVYIYRSHYHVHSWIYENILKMKLETVLTHRVRNRCLKRMTI